MLHHETLINQKSLLSRCFLVEYARLWPRCEVSWRLKQTPPPYKPTALRRYDPTIQKKEKNLKSQQYPANKPYKPQEADATYSNGWSNKGSRQRAACTSPCSLDGCTSCAVILHHLLACTRDRPCRLALRIHDVRAKSRQQASQYLFSRQLHTLPLSGLRQKGY